MVQNKGLYYTAHPTGMPVVGEHLKVQSSDFDTEQAPPQGGITVKTNYVSFDPYQRGRMRKPEAKSYSPPFVSTQLSFIHPIPCSLT
jgi:NADPH-dependent curcumin reductase CurA